MLKLIKKSLNYLQEQEKEGMVTVGSSLFSQKKKDET